MTEMTSHTGRAIIMPNLILIVMVESDMAVAGGDSPPHSRTPSPSRMPPQSVTQDDTFSIENLKLLLPYAHILRWELWYIMAWSMERKNTGRGKCKCIM